MKVQLEGVAETLLIPLWARAHETQKNKNRLLNDPHAIEMIQQIDYDFSKFKKAKGSQIGVAVRSNILDNETLAFIKKHPDALIINLAAGLDTRFYRVNNEHIYWVNIDLPEVIALRKQLLPKELPCTLKKKNYTTCVNLSLHISPILLCSWKHPPPSSSKINNFMMPFLKKKLLSIGRLPKEKKLPNYTLPFVI